MQARDYLQRANSSISKFMGLVTMGQINLLLSRIGVMVKEQICHSLSQVRACYLNNGHRNKLLWVRQRISEINIELRGESIFYCKSVNNRAEVNTTSNILDFVLFLSKSSYFVYLIYASCCCQGWASLHPEPSVSAEINFASQITDF